LQTSKELMDTVGQYRKSNLTPIVIIPGAMESLLEAKLNKKTTVSYICSRTSDWCTLWITESALFASKCFFDDIKMRYLGKRKRPCDSSVLVLWFRLYLTTKTTHSVFGWPAMENGQQRRYSSARAILRKEYPRGTLYHSILYRTTIPCN